MNIKWIWCRGTLVRRNSNDKKPRIMKSVLFRSFKRRRNAPEHHLLADVSLLWFNYFPRFSNQVFLRHRQGNCDEYFEAYRTLPAPLSGVRTTHGWSWRRDFSICLLTKTKRKHEMGYWHLSSNSPLPRCVNKLDSSFYLCSPMLIMPWTIFSASHR